MSMFPEAVIIREVGPRDGLQNESKILPTEDKVAWIDLLSGAGLSYIEVSSFVNPRWIPPLADASEVFRNIRRVNEITYAALVPNSSGLERALAADVDEVVLFLSASESHNRKNLNRSIVESLHDCREVSHHALAAGLPVRAYISTTFGCPYEGRVPVDISLSIAETLLEAGIYEISFADTIGVANPLQVSQFLDRALDVVGQDSMALHFHDTRGTGLANVLTGLEYGVFKFDSAVGGLGGCPYAPGAAGNIATEDLLYMLHGMDIHTGINYDRLMDSAVFIRDQYNERHLPSHALQAT